MEKEKAPNYPQWDANKSHPKKIDELRNAFRQVRDPEIGMDIIQLGLIRNVTISAEKVNIDMILTTPYCPYAPMLMESARKKAEEVLGVPTEIQYGKEVWNQTMMEDDTALNWGLF
jgi:metal-sulfur cluster biosynthetic enzyme